MFPFSRFRRLCRCCCGVRGWPLPLCAGRACLCGSRCLVLQLLSLFSTARVPLSCFAFLSVCSFDVCRDMQPITRKIYLLLGDLFCLIFCYYSQCIVKWCRSDWSYHGLERLRADTIPANGIRASAADPRRFVIIILNRFLMSGPSAET